MATNNNIISALNEKTHATQYAWGQLHTSGVTSSDNPFSTKDSDQISITPDNSAHPTINVLTSKCIGLNISDVQEVPEKLSLQSRPQFRSDFLDFLTVSSDQPVGPEKINGCSAILTEEKTPYSSLNLSFQSHEYHRPSTYLRIKCTDIRLGTTESPIDVIEPIVCSAFLFDNGEVISETWNFTSLQMRQFFPEMSEDSEIAFELRSASEDACVIIAFSRVLQQNQGGACDSYYKKQTESNKNKAKASVSKSWPALNGAWTSFAFIAVPLSEIADAEDEYTFPPAILSDKVLSPDFLSNQIERLKQGKVGSTTPVYVTVQSGISEEEYESSEHVVSHSVCPYGFHPRLYVQNSIVLNLVNVHFDFPPKLKVQNIFVDITLLDESNRLIPAFYPRWGAADDRKLVEHYHTLCSYHEKQPFFHEKVVIRLPFPMPRRATVVFRFMNCNLDTYQLEDFAQAAFDIATPDGRAISDSTTQIGIGYTGTPNASTNPTEKNQLTISTFLRSTILSNVPEISKLFHNGKNIIRTKDLEDRTLVHYFFQILDSLIGNLEANPNEAVTSLINIGRLAKCEEFIAANQSVIDTIPNHGSLTILDLLLGVYYSSYAFRESTTFSPKAHTLIMKGWIHFMQTFADEQKAQRFDVPMAEFLFKLIFKSIVVSGDKDFLSDLADFATAYQNSTRQLARFGLMQAKRLANAVAWFTAALADIQLYVEAEKVLIICTLNIAGGSQDHEVTLAYLDHALHPRMFHALLVGDDTFVPFLQGILTAAVEQPRSQVLQGIYRLIGRMIAFVSNDDKPEVASHLLMCLVPFNTQKMAITNSMMFSLISFILRHCRLADLESFLTSTTEADFFKLLHFILVKSKFVKDEIKSGVDSSSALSSLENRFGSNRLIGAKGKRDFASMKTSKIGFSQPETKERIGIARQSACDVQLGVVHILLLLLEMESVRVGEIMLLIYRLLSLNVAIEIIPQLREVFTKVFTEHTTDVFTLAKPPLALVLHKMFRLAGIVSSSFANLVVEVLVILFTAERKVYPSNNRGLCVITKALSMVSDDVILAGPLHEALVAHAETEPCIKEVLEMVDHLKIVIEEMEMVDKQHYAELRKSPPVVNQPSNPNVNVEMYADCIYEKAMIFKRSPDAVFETLSLLSEYHRKNQFYSETLMTFLYQMGLIVEYLTILDRMINFYDMDHPALAFARLCPILTEAVCPKDIMDDLPNVPCFCDSAPFSEPGIFTILKEIMNFAKQSRLFELSNEILKLSYPLLEGHGMFSTLSQLYQQSQMSYVVIKQMSGDIDRMFGKYYRISFYGSILGRDNGKVFIYRETKLAGLFEVVERLTKTYGQLYGASNIEIINKSGKVDTEKLDPNKGFIQITYVEPSFNKAEAAKRTTVFERGNRLDRFAFETPFVKDNNKLQGSVETQWLRKTVLKVRHQMPSITKRMEVPPEGLELIEYEPIRVSIRQIKERLVAYRNAIAEKSITSIQPLLHGSLLVQVNEGPTKMAEVFLSGTKKTKYTEKMRAIFKEFLKLNKVGLKMHGEWVRTQARGQMALQEGLEEGYDSLKEKLAPYLK